MQLSRPPGVPLKFSQRLQQLQRNPQLVCCDAGESNRTCPFTSQNVLWPPQIIIRKFWRKTWHAIHLLFFFFERVIIPIPAAQLSLCLPLALCTKLPATVAQSDSGHCFKNFQLDSLQWLSCDTWNCERSDKLFSCLPTCVHSKFNHCQFASPLFAIFTHFYDFD